jgi:hypothetical protein
MPKTEPPSAEELYSMPQWDLEEREGFLYLVPAEGHVVELGPVEQACEKLAGWLAARDYGGA